MSFVCVLCVIHVLICLVMALLLHFCLPPTQLRPQHPTNHSNNNNNWRNYHDLYNTCTAPITITSTCTTTFTSTTRFTHLSYGCVLHYALCRFPLPLFSARSASMFLHVSDVWACGSAMYSFPTKYIHPYGNQNYGNQHYRPSRLGL